MPKVINITRTLYSFDELSDKAKEVARQWWRDAENEMMNFDYSYDDFIAVAKCMGIEIAENQRQTSKGRTFTEPAIYWGGFGSQGDGLCFEGSYRSNPGALARILEYAPVDEKLHEIAEMFDLVASRWGGDVTAYVRHSGHYYHEHCTVFNVELDRDSGIDRFNDCPDAQIIEDQMKRLMVWMYRQLEAEYEYRMSDEHVDENINCNEYTFDEHGHRLNADAL